MEKTMKQIPMVFNKIAEDMGKVEDAIDENSRNISRESIQRNDCKWNKFR